MQRCSLCGSSYVGSHACSTVGHPKLSASKPFPTPSGLHEIIVTGERDVQVQCGYTPVRLCKLFGPLAFRDVRVRAVAETCEWIVEAEDVTVKPGEPMRWIEVCRIDGQPDGMYPSEDDGG